MNQWLRFILILLGIILKPNVSNSQTKDTFKQIIKLNQPISEIGFPFIGDFHFKDYQFIEPESGILRYNYFLAGIDLFPFVFLFDKEESRIQGWATFGTRIRVWDKRREPLRSNYKWQSSHAIKTPSLLPGIHLTYQLYPRKKQFAFSFSYIELSFTHHSNGQDAPTLASQDNTLNLPDNYIYNIVDGDFSSNNLTLSMKNSKWTQNSYLNNTYYLKFDALGSEKFDHDDLHKYIIGYNMRYFIGRSNDKTEPVYTHLFDFAISLGTESIQNISLNKALSYTFSYHYRLPFSHHLGVFAKYGYLGQDNYNIYLEQSLHYLRIGLSITNYNLQ
tara:strand:- start:541 stop:1536 length:996 start_codon:yes stop_codon:yes gene_type:complete